MRRAAAFLVIQPDTEGRMMTLLTTRQLADRLGVAEITLRKWRISGRGPAFVRCGSNVRYRAGDVDAWVSARVVTSTSQGDDGR